MKRGMAWAAAAAVAPLTIATVTMADEGGGSHTTVLLKATSSWNDIRYAAYPTGQPELTTVRMTIPANSKLDWHKHLMPNSAYIVSGELTIEEQATGRKAVYRAGQALAESVDNVHRGSTGKAPVVVIVTYAGAEGQPLSVPMTGDGKGER
jgi:quercetin dioxygenase-like cupin family protein